MLWRKVCSVYHVHELFDCGAPHAFFQTDNSCSAFRVGVVLV